MITCASHVPSGALQAIPLRAVISQEELLKVEADLQKDIQGEAREHMEDLKASEAVARQAASELGYGGGDLPAAGPSMRTTGLEAETQEEAEAMLAELDLENYETESEDENVMVRALGPSGLASGLLFTGEDQYLQVNQPAMHAPTYTPAG